MAKDKAQPNKSQKQIDKETKQQTKEILTYLGDRYGEQAHHLQGMEKNFKQEERKLARMQAQLTKEEAILKKAREDVIRGTKDNAEKIAQEQEEKTAQLRADILRQQAIVENKRRALAHAQQAMKEYREKMYNLKTKKKGFHLFSDLIQKIRTKIIEPIQNFFAYSHLNSRLAKMSTKERAEEMEAMRHEAEQARKKYLARQLLEREPSAQTHAAIDYVLRDPAKACKITNWDELSLQTRLTKQVQEIANITANNHETIFLAIGDENLNGKNVSHVMKISIPEAELETGKPPRFVEIQPMTMDLENGTMAAASKNPMVLPITEHVNKYMNKEASVEMKPNAEASLSAYLLTRYHLQEKNAPQHLNEFLRLPSNKELMLINAIEQDMVQEYLNETRQQEQHEHSHTNERPQEQQTPDQTKQKPVSPEQTPIEQPQSGQEQETQADQSDFKTIGAKLAHETPGPHTQIINGHIATAQMKTENVLFIDGKPMYSLAVLAKVTGMMTQDGKPDVGAAKLEKAKIMREWAKDPEKPLTINGKEVNVRQVEGVEYKVDGYRVLNPNKVNDTLRETSEQHDTLIAEQTSASYSKSIPLEREAVYSIIHGTDSFDRLLQGVNEHRDPDAQVSFNVTTFAEKLETGRLFPEGEGREEFGTALEQYISEHMENGQPTSFLAAQLIEEPAFSKLSKAFDLPELVTDDRESHDRVFTPFDELSPPSYEPVQNEFVEDREDEKEPFPGDFPEDHDTGVDDPTEVDDRMEFR